MGPQATGEVVGPAGAYARDAVGVGTPPADGTYRNASNAIGGVGLTKDVATGTWWEHTNVEGVGTPAVWSIASQTGSLLLDLGGVYTIDALQVWNFNLPGNDASGTPYANYQPTSFTLSAVSSGSTLPASWPAATQVRDSAGRR